MLRETSTPTRARVATASLLMRSDEIEVCSDDDGVEISLDQTPPPSEQKPLDASKHDSGPHRTDRASPRTGEPWLKDTISARTKTRAKKGDDTPTALKVGGHPNMIPADEERLQRALKTNVAVKAGERMYHQAKAAMQRKAKSQSHVDPTARDELGAAAVECTFRPSLCAGTAEIMKEAESYRPPAERFDAQELRLARARLIQQHASEKIDTAECTFVPKIEAVSAALVRQRRSASQPNRAESDMNTGERLYKDGQSLRLRQHLLELHVQDMEERERVGGGRRLTQGDADALSRRLRNWQLQRDHNTETARQEWLLSLRPRRSRSNDDSTFFSRLHRSHSASPQRAGEVSSERSRGAQRAASVTRWRMAGPVSDLFEKRPQDSVSGPSERSKALAEELRVIRFRALYSKYLGGRSEPCLSLRDIRDQVTTLFPHDSGVVQAIRATGVKDNEQVSREAFVAALCAFERRYGPQPWGRMEHHRLHEDSDESDDEKSVRRRRLANKPAISAMSQQLASQSRSRRQVPIYEHLLSKGAELKAERQKQEEALKESSMKACTFRPSINASSPRTIKSTPNKRCPPISSSCASSSKINKKRLTCGDAATMNASCELSRPPSPHHHRVHVPHSDERSTPCREVDDLLRKIDEEIHGEADMSSHTPVAVQRCQAPLTAVSAWGSGSEHTRTPPLPSHLPDRKERSSGGAKRQALGSVDWNSSQGGIVGTPNRVTPSPAKAHLFAASVDSLLDSIYCKVDVERRYAKIEARRLSPHRCAPGKTKTISQNTARKGTYPIGVKAFK